MSWATHILQWVQTTSSDSATGSESHKCTLSSDWGLKFALMKLKSLVIADQQAAVNTFSGLVHTARQANKVGSAWSPWFNRGPRQDRRWGLSRLINLIVATWKSNFPWEIWLYRWSLTLYNWDMVIPREVVSDPVETTRQPQGIRCWELDDRSWIAKLEAWD